MSDTSPCDQSALTWNAKQRQHDDHLSERHARQPVSVHAAVKDGHPMFWWLKRGDQLLGYESREVSKDAYELTVRLPDGSERVERFADPQTLHDRQVALEGELAGERLDQTARLGSMTRADFIMSKWRQDRVGKGMLTRSPASDRPGADRQQERRAYDPHTILIAACIVLTAGRSLTAQAPSLVDSSGVVLLNADDTPAEITEAQLVRGALGAPETVRVTVRNRTQEPLVVRVDALLFTEKGILRMQSFSSPVRAAGHSQNFGLVPALGTSTGTIVVHHIDARPDWRVVVAIKEADGPTHTWSAENEVLKQESHARLQ